MLDVYHQVDIFYYEDMEDFLAAVYYNHKYKTMIGVKTLLIEK